MPSMTSRCPGGTFQCQTPLSEDRAQQWATVTPWPVFLQLPWSSLPSHPRVHPWAPTALGYLLFPGNLTHQLLAHQEQFAWELGDPLNSLHQVPYHLEQE